MFTELFDVQICQHIVSFLFVVCRATVKSSDGVLYLFQSLNPDPFTQLDMQSTTSQGMFISLKRVMRRWEIILGANTVWYSALAGEEPELMGSIFRDKRKPPPESGWMTKEIIDDETSPRKKVEVKINVSVEGPIWVKSPSPFPNGLYREVAGSDDSDAEEFFSNDRCFHSSEVFQEYILAEPIMDYSDPQAFRLVEKKPMWKLTVIKERSKKQHIIYDEQMVFKDFESSLDITEGVTIRFFTCTGSRDLLPVKHGANPNPNSNEAYYPLFDVLQQS